MATIRKRKNNDGTWSYNVQIRLKGFKPLAKNWLTLYAAKRWAAQTETEMREGRYFNKAANLHTLAEAINEYIASVSGPNQSDHVTRVLRHLEYWRKELGYHLLVKIEPHTIETKSKELAQTICPSTKRVYSPSTVLLYEISLSIVFSYICRVHTNPRWLTYNIFTSVKKTVPTKGRERYLKSQQDGEDELKRFMHACKEVVEFRRRNKTLGKSPGSLYLYYIVYFALLTGVRTGEIKALKWCDVDLNKGLFRLYDTKNGESYTIELTKEGCELLHEHAKVRRMNSQYVFPSRDGKKSVDWRKPFREAVQFAELSDFRFHDLRRTFGSYLTMEGESDASVQAALRHKCRQSTVVYQTLSQQYKSNAIQNMINARLKIDKVT